jgi:hypothetical protein
MLFPEVNEWHEGMQRVALAVEESMGEPVTVTPVKSGGPNFPNIPEPEKAVDALAVFTSKAETVLMGEGQRISGGLSLSPLITTSKPVFQFRYGALPWPLRQGYRILLHRTGETFEVKDVQPDSVSKIVVPVVQLGRQKETR